MSVQEHETTHVSVAPILSVSETIPSDVLVASVELEDRQLLRVAVCSEVLQIR